MSTSRNNKQKGSEKDGGVVGRLFKEATEWKNTKTGKCSRCGELNELNTDYRNVCPDCQIFIIIEKAYELGREHEK